MHTHPTNKGVQGTALHILERMTDKSASLNHIIKGGGVDLVVQAIQIVKGRKFLWAVVILRHLFRCSTDAWRKAIELGAIPMLIDVWCQDNGIKDDYMYRYGRKISWCGTLVCATLNELFVKNLNRAISIQIAKEGEIKLIVDAIGKYVTPVCLPFTESLNPFTDHFELKDGDIFAHLAMFPADDGNLLHHYVAD
jgi:hypothetical protein